MLLNKITTALAIAAFSAALGSMRLFIKVTYNLRNHTYMTSATFFGFLDPLLPLVGIWKRIYSIKFLQP